MFHRPISSKQNKIFFHNAFVIIFSKIPVWSLSSLKYWKLSVDIDFFLSFKRNLNAHSGSEMFTEMVKNTCFLLDDGLYIKMWYTLRYNVCALLTQIQYTIIDLSINIRGYIDHGLNIWTVWRNSSNGATHFPYHHNYVECSYIIPTIKSWNW